MGFINATSLKLHIHQFRQILVDDPSYDIVGVAESRLSNAVDDHIVNVNGYSIIRQDRNTEGGGVILYVRNTLRATVLAKSNTKVKGKPPILVCNSHQYLYALFTGHQKSHSLRALSF